MQGEIKNTKREILIVKVTIQKSNIDISLQ